VRHPQLKKILLFFLIIGLSLHATGATQLFVQHSANGYKFSKVNEIKKSEISSFFDFEGDELEEVENEDSNEKKIDFSLFETLDKRDLIWNLKTAQIISVYNLKHASKLPLYIHFENYRL